MQWFLQSTRQVNMGNDRRPNLVSKQLHPTGDMGSLDLCGEERLCINSTEMGFEGSAGHGFRQRWDTLICFLAPCSCWTQKRRLRTQSIQPHGHQLPGTLSSFLSTAGARTNHWAWLLSGCILLVSSLSVSSGCGPFLSLMSGQGTGDKAAAKSEVFQCKNGILSYFLRFYLHICTHWVCSVTLIPPCTRGYLKVQCSVNFTCGCSNSQ